MSRDNIFLIGYMASGKTTFGRALAKATGRRFVDLDEYIEMTRGTTISEIFSQYGEAEFRRVESAVLRQLTSGSGLIVACGGGTPCHDDNMQWLKSSGFTVWLDAPIETLLRRLRLECSKRPLVSSLDPGDELREYVVKNLERRIPYYSLAHIRFDSSRLESEEEISDTIDMFKRLCPIEL